MSKRVEAVIPGLILLLPTTAYAVQRHGGIEGLISHLMGHALFISGIVIFLIWIRSYHETGWPPFKGALSLLLAWNVLTASGHILAEFQDPADFIKSAGEVIAYRADSFADFYFYLTRLDHFLLVPAFILLIIALIKWRGAGDTLPRPEMDILSAPEVDKR